MPTVPGFVTGGAALPAATGNGANGQVLTADGAGNATWENNAGIGQKAISFNIPGTVTDVTLYLTTYAPYACTINSVQNIQTSAGTVTAAVKINGTNVTGLGSISVTSSSQDVNATAANTVAVGNEITVVLSSSSSAANLRGTVVYTQ